MIVRIRRGRCRCVAVKSRHDCGVGAGKLFEDEQSTKLTWKCGNRWPEELMMSNEIAILGVGAVTVWGKWGKNFVEYGVKERHAPH